MLIFGEFLYFLVMLVLFSPFSYVSILFHMESATYHFSIYSFHSNLQEVLIFFRYIAQADTGSCLAPCLAHGLAPCVQMQPTAWLEGHAGFGGCRAWLSWASARPTRTPPSLSLHAQARKIHETKQEPASACLSSA